MDAIEQAIVFSLLIVATKHAFTAIKITNQLTDVKNAMRNQVIAYPLLKINRHKSKVI